MNLLKQIVVHYVVGYDNIWYKDNKNRNSDLIPTVKSVR